MQVGPELEKICYLLHRLVLKGEKGWIHLASIELSSLWLLLWFGWQMSRGQISPAMCSLHSSHCAQSGSGCADVCRAQHLHTQTSAPALPSEMLQKVAMKITLKEASWNTIYRCCISFSTIKLFTLNFYVVPQLRTGTHQHLTENRNIRFEPENFSKLFNIPHKNKKY